MRESYYDYDEDGQRIGVDILSRTYVKRARKEHRCATCGDVIPVGTGYVKLFVVYEGRGMAYPHHGQCPRW